MTYQQEVAISEIAGEFTEHELEWAIDMYYEIGDYKESGTLFDKGSK